jgi:lipid II isoglutaminyl synthase (glutamine-hydrolysing)
MAEPRRRLLVGALYPDLLNIYADRGNLMVLRRRCAWRGLECEIVDVRLGERLDRGRFDLLYLGGGQDADQRRCGDELSGDKGEALREASAEGVVILAVCGGYQLLGHSYQLGDESVPGAGVLDLRTVRAEGPRLVGNVAIEATVPGVTGPRVLAGFENHGGRTILGAGQEPLGRVIRGHGNDGESGYEGARTANTIGTYLHGPLLPGNAWFADWLISTATGNGELLPLDDALEDEAHAAAMEAAGLPERR